MRYRKQKQIKAKKKAVSENTAINVGYANAVFNKIPAYALILAVKECAGFIGSVSKEKQIENILITESVKNMNYQDFREIENYFFD